jgi:hypothetical protein
MALLVSIDATKARRFASLAMKGAMGDHLAQLGPNLTVAEKSRILVVLKLVAVAAAVATVATGVLNTLRAGLRCSICY